MLFVSTRSTNFTISGHSFFKGAPRRSNVACWLVNEKAVGMLDLKLLERVSQVPFDIMNWVCVILMAIYMSSRFFPFAKQSCRALNYVNIVQKS